MKGAVILFGVWLNKEDIYIGLYKYLIRQHQEVATLVKIHGMV